MGYTNAESDAGEDAMKHMVDDIVGPEDDVLWTPAQRVPQADTSVLKPTPTTIGNTNYGPIGTMTAQELAQQMRASKSPKSPSFQREPRQSVSPRPHLPTISPNPFTPIPGELDNISPITSRNPSYKLPAKKLVYSIPTSSEDLANSTPFSPVKYASSPMQARNTNREDFKRARTFNAIGAESPAWGVGENWPPNGQG